MAERRPVALWAALAAIVAFAAYAAHLPGHVSIGDAAEAQTVPFILGIAHPTGFPAFTLAGWLFTHAFAVGAVAWRMNVFTALCTSATTGIIVALAMELGSDAATAVLAALAFALGAMVWGGALVANAQILAGPCEIAAFLGSLIVARTGERRTLYATCAVAGIGIAVHPMAVWVVPAIVVAAWWQRRSFARSVSAVALTALLVPLLLYAYLPLRSTVVAAHGLDPTARSPMLLGGGIDWDMNQPRTLAGFLDEVLGRNEGAGSSLATAFDPRGLPDAATFWLALARRQYAPLTLVLALAGAVALALHDRRALSVLASGTLGGVLFAHAYATDTHIDRYLFCSFAVVAALLGASARVAKLRVGRVDLHSVVALILAIGVGQAYAANHGRFDGAPLEDGQAIVDAVARDTPGGAIVVAQWNDAAALGYGAFVERALGSRTIVSGWPDTYQTAYTGWARVRPVVLYESRLAMMRAISFPSGARLRERHSSLAGYRVFDVVPIAGSDEIPHAGGRAGSRGRALTW